MASRQAELNGGQASQSMRDDNRGLRTRVRDLEAEVRELRHSLASRLQISASPGTDAATVTPNRPADEEPKRSPPSSASSQVGESQVDTPATLPYEANAVSDPHLANNAVSDASDSATECAAPQEAPGLLPNPGLAEGVETISDTSGFATHQLDLAFNFADYVMDPSSPFTWNCTVKDLEDLGGWPQIGGEIEGTNP